MARLCNQIICVCAFLSNFQPALVPPSSQDFTEVDVEDYFLELGLGYSEDESSDSEC